MKKIFLLAIATLIFVTLIGVEAFAQENKEDDTLKIKWKGSKIWIFDDQEIAKIDSAKKDKKDFTHWGGIDFGISMLTTVNNKLKLPDGQEMNNFLELNYGKSLYFSLNLLEKNIRLYKNYVNVVTGLGFEWNSYNFKKNITLDADADFISVSNTSINFGGKDTSISPDDIKLSRNKLKIAYVKAPLLLELNTSSENPDKSFHVAAGIEFAYKIGSKTKQVYEINGYQFNVTRRDKYHLADIKYCSVVRVGYGNYFTLFANYGLSELFEKDKGPEVFPFNAGISFTF